MSEAYQPVTIGSLRRANRVLEAHCNACAHFTELDANTLPFADGQPVPTAGRRMKCSRFGSRSVVTRPQVGAETVAAHRARAIEQQQREMGQG